MGWVQFGLVIVYLVGLRVVGRRYFARRHGVSFEVGEIGGLRAALVGMFWPVTVWMPATRNPQFCSHHRHVLRRKQLMDEIRLVQELKDKGL